MLDKAVGLGGVGLLDCGVVGTRLKGPQIIQGPD